MNVLVTGATGYIGGRLVPRLLRRGHRVRVLARDPRRLQGRPWSRRVDVVRGDLLRPGTLPRAFRRIDAAYYLVHSMHSGPDFMERDREAVSNFCAAAGGLDHVVYLGGLMPREGPPSAHLASRAEMGRRLAEVLPVTEFRAGPIIGSGSASFEMIRYLCERLPVLIAPSWIRNPVHPIAVRDVLSYLVYALERPPAGVVNIGTEVMTFESMLREYARVRGLRRLVFVVPPVLPPRVGARLVGMVTPIPNTLAVPLVESIVRPLPADRSRAAELFPEIRPIPYARAVALALRRIREGRVETRWSGARLDDQTYELRDREGMIQEIRTLHVEAPPDRVFRVFSGLGGERGWLVWNWAWRVRGILDRLVGGPGLRRGRRHPQELLPGEAVDWWRVETVRPPRLLRLRAEVRLPGRGWLEWEVKRERGGTRLRQIASFWPDGFTGVVYWYLLYPFHRRIFTGMIQGIRRLAEARSEEEGPRGAPGTP